VKEILRVLAWLSLISGIVLAAFMLFQATDVLGSMRTGSILAAAYFISGLAGFAVFGGMAEILERLQRLEGINR
jgi:Na+-driven multidrug efflux pump